MQHLKERRGEERRGVNENSAALHLIKCAHKHTHQLLFNQPKGKEFFFTFKMRLGGGGGGIALHR